MLLSLPVGKELLRGMGKTGRRRRRWSRGLGETGQLNSLRAGNINNRKISLKIPILYLTVNTYNKSALFFLVSLEIPVFLEYRENFTDFIVCI